MPNGSSFHTFSYIWLGENNLKTVLPNDFQNGLPVFKVHNTDLFDVADSSNKIVYANTDVQFESTPDGY